MARVQDDPVELWCYQPGQTWDKTWHPVPQTVQGAVLAAKDFWRKYFVPGKLDKKLTLLICNRRKLDGAGGDWNHERPFSGKHKPTKVYDAITPRSWASGERSVKELAAVLKGRVLPKDGLTVGYRIPDWSYRLEMTEDSQTKVLTITVRRDDDEKQEDFPEIGAAPVLAETADNDRAQWLYRFIPASGSAPEEYLSDAVLRFSPRESGVLEVIDERRESGLMTLFIKRCDCPQPARTNIRAVPYLTSSGNPLPGVRRLIASCGGLLQGYQWADLNPTTGEALTVGLVGWRISSGAAFKVNGEYLSPDAAKFAGETGEFSQDQPFDVVEIFGPEGPTGTDPGTGLPFVIRVDFTAICAVLDRDPQTGRDIIRKEFCTTLTRFWEDEDDDDEEPEEEPEEPEETEEDRERRRQRQRVIEGLTVLGVGLGIMAAAVLLPEVLLAGAAVGAYEGLTAAGAVVGATALEAAEAESAALLAEALAGEALLGEGAAATEAVATQAAGMTAAELASLRATAQAALEYAKDVVLPSVLRGL